MKNKKGIGAVAVTLSILGLLILGGIAFGVYRQSVTGGTGDVETLNNCQTEPYLSIIAVDTLNPGTSITPTVNDSIKNGQYVGAINLGSSGSTFSINDELDVVINGSGYLTKEIKDFKITKCGENEIITELGKLDGTPTVKIFNDAGNQLTDSVNGTINQSSSSDPITVDLHFTMPTDEYAEEVVFVVEASNTTEIDKISMNGNQGSVTDYEKNQPDSHSIESSDGNGLFNSFRATGFASDGGKTIYSITFEPESGETIGAGRQQIFITWYFPQYGADTDGSIILDIEDSDGTALHEASATSDYDFAIGNQP